MPYQSRLLTFLSERSLKLRDQAQRRLRQMKLATAWSAQILLYPAYAAFQSTRVVSRQVGQAARRVFPRLQAAAQGVKQSVDPSPSSPPPQAPPASDSPIRQTLRSLDLLALPLPVASAGLALSPHSTAIAEVEAPQDAVAAPSSATSSIEAGQPQAPQHQPLPQVRGIACLVDSQRLVLVDQHNAIHDVLTPAQAAYLQRRLVLALAQFWRVHKQLQLSHRAVTPLPLPRDRKTMLPPVQAWHRLMAWMQTGPVALSVNLFQETKLPKHLLRLPSREFNHSARGQSSEQPAFPLPPRAPAPSAPAPAASRSWWLQLVPRWLQTGDRNAPSTPNWFDPDHQGDEDGWQSANQAVAARETQRPPVRPSLPIPAQQRWAGLKFWGRPDDSSPDDGLSPAGVDNTGDISTGDISDRSGNGQIEVLPKSEDGAIDLISAQPPYRPPLTLLDELEQYLQGFVGSLAGGLTGAEATGSELAKTTLNQSQLSPDQLEPLQLDQAQLQRLWADQSKVGDMAREHSLGLGDRRTAGRSASPSPLTADSASGVSGKETGPLATGSSQDLQTTWIETQATHLGYDRHPLAQILNWIDRGIVRIEAWLIKALQWFNKPS
ncbi:MAG: hypothetical protein ACFB4J_08130 [Elainellaceae cyanobacterium]